MVNEQKQSSVTLIIQAIENEITGRSAEDIGNLVSSLMNLMYSIDLHESLFTAEEFKSIKGIIVRLEDEMLVYALKVHDYEAVESIADCIGKLKSFK